MRFLGRVTFEGRVRLFRYSVTLATELFVRLSWEPSHQVLIEPSLMANAARWKYSKFRSMLALSGDQSGSFSYAAAMFARSKVPVVGSVFPGLWAGNSLSEFHTTTFRNVVAGAGAPLSVSATKSRQAF